ncbi:uncharacterized protein TRUGW13939_10348 [Talaromyces rugulosus]|uniref:Uncharacterized protein n=1 Tax=Talaromyces rugulosus TaxID=121627 RepID=A0A7H8R9S0_TALRU|nr:uncharacterized protein TRUGW13939_10348 [Talaromyces rugulosus]QKX63179.1 hypothetical protein TRUGW13939_10348 [Talaromyces rugulosus]
MEVPGFIDEEIHLATERCVKLQGTAKVQLDDIQFDPPLPQGLDAKNLKRLDQMFRKNGCRRLVVDNHIPVIVSRQSLSTSLQRAGVSPQALRTMQPDQFPLLCFSTGQLRGLHGRHRAQVGRKLLPPVDRWWTVDLYLDDIDSHLKTNLIEEYSDQQKVTDGEIYRKIRQYEAGQNELFRERWLARFSRSSQERFEQIDKRKNRGLRCGFDSLLPIPGLWRGGMRVSMMHRVIASNCTKEILTYLNHIKHFWSTIVDHDPLSMNKIDEDTVQQLQLKAPRLSRIDRENIHTLIRGGKIFISFSDMEREMIWSRMEHFDGLIPSLYTFFEDFKYLEDCASCVKRLLPDCTDSVWRTMSEMFVASPEAEQEVLIQTSESMFRTIRAPGRDCLDLAYRQVWLYAMRYYPLMPPEPKHKEDLLANQTQTKPDESTIHEMAELAERLGFQSDEITKILSSSPDLQIAMACLLQARKKRRFRYHPHQINDLVNQIVRCFSAAVPIEAGLPSPRELLVDSVMKPRARCGRPTMGAHQQDSQYLFIDVLHSDDVLVGDTITTFDVRRCVYFAFFGNPSIRSGRDGVGPSTDAHPTRPMSPLFVPSSQPPNHSTMSVDSLAGGEGRDRDLQGGGIGSQPIGIENRDAVSPGEELPDGGRGSNAEEDRATPRPLVEYSEELLGHNVRHGFEAERFDSESVYSEHGSGAGRGGLGDMVRRELHRSREESPQLMSPEAPSHHSQSNLMGLAQGPDPQIEGGPESQVDEQAYRDQLEAAGLEQVRIEEPLEEEHQPVPSPAVTITFWSLERDQWREAGRYTVNPSDPSLVERAATKYTWKDFWLHDRNLQDVTVARCFRSAVDDGSYSIFLLSGHERQKLTAEENFHRSRELISLAQRVLDSTDAEQTVAAVPDGNGSFGGGEWREESSRQGVDATDRDMENLLDEMLQNDAELRAAGDHDAQDLTLWEAQHIPSPAEIQSEDEANVDRERDVALERLQGGPSQSETLMIPSDSPQGYAQLNPQEWGGADSSDAPSRVEGIPSVPRPMETKTGKKGPSKKLGVTKSPMKGRPTIQQTQKEASRVAAVADELGLDLDGPPSAFTPAIEPSTVEPRPPYPEGSNPGAQLGNSAPDPQALAIPGGHQRANVVTGFDFANQIAQQGVAQQQVEEQWVEQQHEGPPNPTNMTPIGIKFYHYDGKGWEKKDVLPVNPSNTMPLEKIVQGFKKRKFVVVNMKKEPIDKANCFYGATIEGSNALFVIPKSMQNQIKAMDLPQVWRRASRGRLLRNS